MPRLPRTPLHEVQPVRNNRSVTPIQRVSGEDAVGDALGKTGNAAFEIGSRLRDAQITNEVAKAHNDLNLKLDAEYRQMEKDTGDPLELEAKWQERAKQVVSEASGGMTSPMHRRLFDAQAAQLAEGYQIKTRDLTRKKQVDGAIADSARQLDALAEVAADPEVSLDVLQSNTDTTLAAAKRLYNSGFITETQLAEWQVKAEDQLQVGKSVRNEKRVSDLMDAGDAVSIAQARLLMEDKDFRADILPAQREALDDALKVKAQAADAFGKADQLMAEAGGDYGKAIAGARQIKDPELRQNVESRLTTMKEQDNQADIIKQRDVLDDGLGYLLNGGSVASIPTSLYSEANNTTRDWWRKYVEGRQKTNQETEADRIRKNALSAAAKLELETLKVENPELYQAGPIAWAAYDGLLSIPVLSLNEKDLAALTKDAATFRENGGSLDTATEIFKDLAAQAPYFRPPSLGIEYTDDIGDQPGTKKLSSTRSKKPLELRVEGVLMELAKEEARKSPGGKISDQRAKELWAMAWARVGEKKDGTTKYPIPQDVAGSMAARDIQSAAITTAANDPEAYARARSIALQQNPDAKNEDILMIYRRIQARRAQYANEKTTFSQGDR